MNKEHLYTKEEAAQILGISVATLESQRAKDRIKAQETRPDVLIHANEIIRYRRDSQPEKHPITGGDFYMVRDGKNAPYTGTSFGGIDPAAAAKEPEDTRAIGDAEAVSGEPA